jgi:5'-3' exonuclease
MTIKGLWDYYNKKIKYGTIKSSELKGKRIAVDAYEVMYATRSVAKEMYMKKINPFMDEQDESEIDKIWISKSLAIVMSYLKTGFLPVLVYDGKKSDLKSKTLIKRAKDKTIIRNNILSMLNQYKDFNILQIPVEATDKLRSLMSRVDIMSKESAHKFINFFKRLGIPYAMATGEGERTCSLLNKCGIAYAVLSSDSDCLPCGANLVLKEKCQIYDNKNFGSPGYKTAELSAILSNLDMNMDTFVELCIMSGTDFNDNIKNISFNKSYVLLKEYGSIKKIGRSGKDIKILNHKAVKENFEYVEWKDTVIEYCFDFSFNHEEEVKALEDFDLVSEFSDLTQLKKSINIT